MRKTPVVDILVITLAVAFCVSCGSGTSSPAFTNAQLQGEYTNGPFDSVSPFIKVGLHLNGSTLSGFSDVVKGGPPCLKLEGYALSLKGTVSGHHLHWDVTTSPTPGGGQAIYSFDGSAQVNGDQVQQISGTLTLVS